MDLTPAVFTRGLFYKDDSNSFKNLIFAGHEVRVLWWSDKGVQPCAPTFDPACAHSASCGGFPLFLQTLLTVLELLLFGFWDSVFRRCARHTVQPRLRYTARPF